MSLSNSSQTAHQIIDREQQIITFNNILNEILSGNKLVGKNVIQYYGGPGIGKTTLVTRLIQECRTRDISWVKVNFKREPTDTYLKDPTILLEKIANELSQKQLINCSSLHEKIAALHVSGAPGALIRAYYDLPAESRIYEQPVWLESLGRVVTQFIELLSQSMNPFDKDFKPIALFFDEGDYAHPDLVDWIEEWLISPLAKTKACIIVWTARRPWRWKRPEVRRRMIEEQIPVFNEGDVEKHLAFVTQETELEKQLFVKVLDITNGHPYAGKIVNDHILIWIKQGTEISKSIVSDHESELREDIFNKVIRKYAFVDLKREEKIALELLSMVRMFDETMMREVLQKYEGGKFLKWSQDEFQGMLQRLRRTQLLIWNKAGYTLDPDLSYLIRGHYLCSRSTDYIRINKIALQVYRDWLTRPVDNRTQFVMEELYHRAALLQAGEDEDLEKTIDERIDSYHRWFPETGLLYNALGLLLGNLEDDRDLRMMINADSFRTMLEKIELELQKLQETNS